MTAATFPPPPFVGRASASPEESLRPPDESLEPPDESLEPPNESLEPPNESLQGPGDATLRLLARSAGGTPVRALCINLDRRPERWEAFNRNCPIRGVHRFPAIDGRRVRPPVWWRQGGGAWGCMLSHIRILEQALTDGLDRRGVVLVLEDDALFPPDFAEQATRFISALPGDWD